MNPLTFFRSAPYIVIAILLALLGWTTHLYLGKRDQIAALTASVQALGQAAEKVVEEKKAEYATNLQTVKEDHERLIPAIRAGAVRNYRDHHPDGVLNNSGCGAVPGPSTGVQVDDGTQPKRIPDDTTLGNCAEDASKVAAFQQYCSLNHCPVKD